MVYLIIQKQKLRAHCRCLYKFKQCACAITRTILIIDSFTNNFKKHNKFSTVLLLRKCNLMKCEVAKYSRSPMRHGYFSNPLEKGIRVH